VGSDNAATLYRISVWDVRHEPNTPSIRNLFLIDVLLISGADKLHNTRAIVSDLKSVGQIVFERFSTKKDGTLWYYESLADIFEARKAPMAKPIRETVKEILGLTR
jgi:hypothetical protein